MESKLPTHLKDFQLSDLAQYTKEAAMDSKASKDVLVLYVGRDNPHEALKHILSGCTSELVMNMFGYDDEEINDIIWQKIKDPNIVTTITLDLSQASGTHEKKLLDMDRANDLKAFNTHIVIGQSATHQISHTKGGTVDGKVSWEGSMNLSVTGEGYLPKGVTGTVKSQNNTCAFITDPETVNKFRTELINEHLHAGIPKKKAGK